MLTVEVGLGDRSYPIYIGRGLLGDASLLVGHLAQPRVAIVTNETVAPSYLGKLVAGLTAQGVAVIEVVLPDGESHKTWQSLGIIYDRMLAAHCERRTTVVALGGGVVGDLAGFAAATYNRGLAFLQVPTTLLAMVDSSVGGKTGINSPLGKNLIGAFLQPMAVLADLDALKTLQIGRAHV